ncbi:MAG: UDP-N-acetylglucosamine 2-epimerase (non-hydrolyzing) [Candidatus Thorarchaeota archaeon]|nr:UDP-N-acetylglucosamine 2-epimerase (non-hydrolyzing) [Candidatus Thorarchaeota archaeon]
MRVSIVTGTRPQITKSAPVLVALEEKGVDVRFIHTGQHYDYELADQFISEFSIRTPDHNLEVGSGSSSYQTYEVMSRLERVLSKETPEYLIVPGDTNSALGAALAGFKMDIPTCHIESGLRSFDMKMQEEINRRLIDHGAAGLFAPTNLAVKNLDDENVPGMVFQTGDTMYDILKKRLQTFNDPSFQEETKRELGISEEKFGVLTMHRRENVDFPDRLKGIIDGLGKIEHRIIFPMHPRTKQSISDYGFSIPKNVKVVDPIPYTTMMTLVSRSSLLLTDSGGLQKEAYLLNTPCVTIRDNSEWVETLSAGANVLVAPRGDEIHSKANEMWDRELKNDPTVYGDGQASEKIAEIVASGEIVVRDNVMLS